MFHCDAGATRSLVDFRVGRKELVEQHLTNLRVVASGRAQWVPVFNYDFCREGRFNVDSSPSQVGPISEAFRGDESDWRTLAPVFNVCGVGASPSLSEDLPAQVEAFGANSAFADLYEMDGVIVWYGAPLSSTTYLHHVETLSGGPLYRYEKDFPGEVTRGDRSWQTVLRYHVRPMGTTLDYCWSEIELRARSAGVVRQISGTPIAWASARELAAHWLGLLGRDPFALLDVPSRRYFEPMLEDLGRRLNIADFELMASE